MPRLSPQELQAAKRRSQETRKNDEKAWADGAEVFRNQRDRFFQLHSVCDSLYEEVDKLNKKAPAVQVSTLTLARVNKAIRAVRELTDPDNDEFLADLDEFVPAGDMPEYRDVTLRLSELRAGLNRYRSRHMRDWSRLDPMV